MLPDIVHGGAEQEAHEAMKPITSRQIASAARKLWGSNLADQAEGRCTIRAVLDVLPGYWRNLAQTRLAKLTIARAALIACERRATSRSCTKTSAGHFGIKAVAKAALRATK